MVPVRRVVSGAVRPVEADEGVEVDQAAGLVFGDLGEGKADVAREFADGDSGVAGQALAGLVSEAVPESAGAGVEQHGPGVVVAVGAQRLAQFRVVGLVPVSAPQRVAVRADGLVSARMARHGSAVAFGACVHGAERGSGEGEEQAGGVAGLPPGRSCRRTVPRG